MVRNKSPHYIVKLGRGHGNPLQCSCPENPMVRESLVGYSPCGHRELDRTEATSHTHIPLRDTSKKQNEFLLHLRFR